MKVPTIYKANGSGLIPTKSGLKYGTVPPLDPEMAIDKTIQPASSPRSPSTASLGKSARCKRGGRRGGSKYALALKTSRDGSPREVMGTPGCTRDVQTAGCSSPMAGK